MKRQMINTYGTIFIILALMAISVSVTRAQDSDEPVDPADVQITISAVEIFTGTVPIEITVVPTVTAVVLPTQTITATALPTQTPAATPTVEVIEPTATPLEPTAAPVDYGGDVYEIDGPNNPVAYIGVMNRSFAPAGDADYVRFNIKAGRTEIRTLGLTGAADTYIEIYDTSLSILLESDDDSGEGFGSWINLESEHAAEIVIVIRNKSAGYGEGVNYTLQITPEQLFTPTPTLVPTETPRATPTNPATPVPLPTYTPYPTQTPVPTAVPLPPVPVVVRPAATEAPVIQLTLRVQVYTDGDKDGILDVGEGVQDALVEIETLNGQFYQSGYTVDGVWIVEVECPPGKHELRDLEISIPYLQQTQVLNSLTTDWEQVSFLMDAPILPIALP